MVARHHKELIAWQLADAFNREVHRIHKSSAAAKHDFRYRDQLLNAASDVDKDIVEGFLRKSPLEFAKFLDYALASLGEAERRLHDGILRAYFDQADCAQAFNFAKRCLTASVRLKASQIRHAERLARERRSKRRRGR